MDPLSSLVALMRPQTVVSKLVSGSGCWAARYARSGIPGFGVVVTGKCHFRADGCEPVELSEGDFTLLPTGPGFVIASDPDVEPDDMQACPAAAILAETQLGPKTGTPDFRLLGGYFRFGAPNSEMLTQILPALIHVKCADNTARRIADTLGSLRGEALDQRPGRDLIIQRLIEVMLIEALRYRSEQGDASARPGLLNGLADDRVGRALTSLHADVARPWSVASLAEEAHLSRTAFSERFSRLVGMPPMTYLTKWRMAVAKDILQRKRLPQDVVAATVGYQSASAFNTAFRREVGQAPGEYIRANLVLTA
ncbi:AraC family transcriptional regulator [Bradyrhizobium commune]|uniref:AraC family transcriptional regulator n=1 Tax=Bradyrhizobium commune TaxID=83627 RepID=A0A7S9D721_9BRAD|nr:AraC family transcriptional regulator [Bradyrhizobium commune]QPF92406.1 AraC family transcriptional regulator [Bradyrhizobium commune]